MKWAALEWLGAADKGRTIRVGDNRGLVRAFAFNADWPEDVGAGSVGKWKTIARHYSGLVRPTGCAATSAKRSKATKVIWKRQEEALQLIDRLDRWQSVAGMLHRTALDRGYDVKFMGIQKEFLQLGRVADRLRPSVDDASHVALRDEPTGSARELGAEEHQQAR
jgi:hypothetical protein